VPPIPDVPEEPEDDGEPPEILDVSEGSEERSGPVKTVKLMIRSGRVGIANKDLPVGTYGPVKIIEVVGVPYEMRNWEVVEKYSHVVDIGDYLTRTFSELNSRVLYD
jgi:hypothetical protein